MPGRLRAIRSWLAARTSTQLAATIAILSAAALSGSLYVTGLAVQIDQREKAALAALADYAAMVSKLGSEESLNASNLTEADSAYLTGWLSAFQSGPTREARTLEETCRTGRGGAGVRFIRGPVGKPAGLAALATDRAERQPSLGQDVYLVRLDRGELCPGRAVDVVVVRRTVGALDISVGRVADQSGQAWGWAVLAVAATGLILLVSGVATAAFARRRLMAAVSEVNLALERAAIGDFSRRAPEVGVAPELTQLTVQVNRTLDRLQELLNWMRDSSDQLAHDFRTPLARASARLAQMDEATPAQARRLGVEVRGDLNVLTRAMNETMALRDGEAWVFEPVRLDTLAHAAAELYQPLAEARGIAVVVEVEEASTLGVRSLMQRAVTNLMDNAVKFSPDGGQVTVRVRHEAEGSLLSIADQGPGCDPALLDDPAAMRAAAAAEGRESHGMGLSFVRAIMRRHGGRMTIDDAEPGAVVTLRFSR